MSVPVKKDEKPSAAGLPTKTTTSASASTSPSVSASSSSFFHKATEMDEKSFMNMCAQSLLKGFFDVAAQNRIPFEEVVAAYNKTFPIPGLMGVLQLFRTENMRENPELFAKKIAGVYNIPQAKALRMVQNACTISRHIDSEAADDPSPSSLQVPLAHK